MTTQLILTKADTEALDEHKNVHRFNDKAIRHTKSPGDIAGFTMLGIHLVRVEPGDETTQHHNHELSDEFVYIFSGEATLLLDNKEYTCQRTRTFDEKYRPNGSGLSHGWQQAGY